jgi:hypothetical protein
MKKSLDLMVFFIMEDLASGKISFNGGSDHEIQHKIVTK